MFYLLLFLTLLHLLPHCRCSLGGCCSLHAHNTKGAKPRLFNPTQPNLDTDACHRPQLLSMLDAGLEDDDL